jgi:hypothetical protein
MIYSLYRQGLPLSVNQSALAAMASTKNMGLGKTLSIDKEISSFAVNIHDLCCILSDKL